MERDLQHLPHSYKYECVRICSQLYHNYTTSYNCVTVNTVHGTDSQQVQPDVKSESQPESQPSQTDVASDAGDQSVLQSLMMSSNDTADTATGSSAVNATTTDVLTSANAAVEELTYPPTTTTESTPESLVEAMSRYAARKLATAGKTLWGRRYSRRNSD